MQGLAHEVSEERISHVAETPAGRFAQVCAEHGGRVALTSEGQQVTYAELDARSSAMADELARAGAEPGQLVALCLERGVEMIVAMLAVAKTGAAYLPIDPAYPAARIEETLDDARPLALVDERGLHRRGDALPVDERTAYVIYTSGSTGRPKGVMISRESLLSLLDETVPWFGFGPDDVWTMFHSFAFDFSVWEIWGPLLTGGRLVVVPFAVTRSPLEFRELLVRERVTVLNQTPSAFALLSWVDARAETELALRVVIFGGEALSMAVLRDWMGRHGDRRPELINMYGITETTVHVTYRRVRSGDAEETDSLIGVPLPHLDLLLLDDELRPVPDGEEGEICVAGPGVALGYLRRPELTAERFVLDPATGARLYRSGDRARRRADGELVYLGRRDGQVKVAGFRIELGEVEAALLGCAGVEQACAVVWSGRLVAFVRGSELRESSLAADLGAEMSARVPAHLRPALYRLVDTLPLTLNGKADRAALAEQLDRQRTDFGSQAAGSGEGLAATILRVWQEVLGTRDVGLDSNFFDVGGTSLLLVRVRAALGTELGREIPVVWMFECTTVRALAERLGSGPAAVPAAAVLNAEKARGAFARAKSLRGAR